MGRAFGLRTIVQPLIPDRMAGGGAFAAGFGGSCVLTSVAFILLFLIIGFAKSFHRLDSTEMAVTWSPFTRQLLGVKEAGLYFRECPPCLSLSQRCSQQFRYERLYIRLPLLTGRSTVTTRVLLHRLCAEVFCADRRSLLEVRDIPVHPSNDQHRCLMRHQRW